MGFTIRNLRAEEIEVRPAHKVKDKVSMLLYIDSRAVTNYLDEMVGSMNWATEFYEVNGQIIGKLGIWDSEKNIWVWKSDVGTESNIEKEKGLISDTYKRLLSRWGVTHLYTAPQILLEDDGYNNTGYKVLDIDYNDRKEITRLVIGNRWGKEVYSWSSEGRVSPTIETTSRQPQKSNMEILKEFFDNEKKKEGINKEQLTAFKNYYKTRVEDWKGVFRPEEMYRRWCERGN